MQKQTKNSLNKSKMMLKRKNEEEMNDQQKLSTVKRLALDADVTEPNEDEILLMENDVHSDGDAQLASDNEENSKKISSHKVHSSDPTFVHFRMLCQVKEAAVIVGKGGETISHLKEVSSTAINVSDNIRGISERVVHVKGSAENVAKAFGLITRTILEEEEDTPSNAESREFGLQLLIPHPVMGFIIGKQGNKFREIEGKSAAELVSSPENLIFSTDRLLHVTGVADAIHIATYYIAETILENQSKFKGNYIYYNPASIIQIPQAYQPHPQTHPFQLSQSPQPHQHHLPNIPSNSLPLNSMPSYQLISPPIPQGHYQTPFSQQNKFGYSQRSASNLRYRYQKHPQQFDQFNNRLIAPAINPLIIHQGPQVSEFMLIPNEYVGNIIGKNGKNIKLINERTGSRINVEDPEPESEWRKITITGSDSGNQQAMMMISSKIETDRASNEAKAARLKDQNDETSDMV